MKILNSEILNILNKHIGKSKFLPKNTTDVKEMQKESEQKNERKKQCNIVKYWLRQKKKKESLFTLYFNEFFSKNCAHVHVKQEKRAKPSAEIERKWRLWHKILWLFCHQHLLYYNPFYPGICYDCFLSHHGPFPYMIHYPPSPIPLPPFHKIHKPNK